MFNTNKILKFEVILYLNNQKEVKNHQTEITRQGRNNELPNPDAKS